MKDLDEKRRRRIQIGTDLINFEVRELARDIKRKANLKEKLSDQIKIEEAYNEFLDPRQERKKS